MTIWVKIEEKHARGRSTGSKPKTWRWNEFKIDEMLRQVSTHLSGGTD